MFRREAVLVAVYVVPALLLDLFVTDTSWTVWLSMALMYVAVRFSLHRFSQPPEAHHEQRHRRNTY